MEELQKPKTSKHAINFGILLGVLSVAYVVILYVLNMQFAIGLFGLLIQILIIIATLIIAMSLYKKENHGWMSLSEALKLGMGVALIGGIIIAIFQIVLTEVIDPEYKNKNFDFQYQKMVEANPNMTQEELDMSVNIMKKLTSPYVVFPSTIIMILFFGFIISMILGLIMKKQPPQN